MPDYNVTLSTSQSRTKRVYVDVPKLTSKPPKMLASKLSMDAKAKSNLSSPLSDATNSASSNENKKRKRGQDADGKKDAKEPAKPNKRRQIEKPAKNDVSETKAAAQKSSAPNTTAEAPAKKPAPKPPKQPLWTRVGVNFTREEVEQRIMLREFALRFNDCLGLKRVTLEKLEDFGEFDESVAKALLLAILEVLKSDASKDERRRLGEFNKQIRSRGMSVYDIMYTLQELREKTDLNIPDLSAVLKQNPHLVEPFELIPVMLALFDDMLQTKEVRKELDRFKEEGVEIRKNYYSKMKEEKERWGKIRTAMFEEKKQPPPDFDLSKWKRKFDNAKAKHDGIESTIRFEYTKAQSSIALRFTPLMDKDGRVYYIHTPSLRKPPAKSTRNEFLKWTWYVAVWGKRPADATRIDDAEDGDNSDDNDKDQDDSSDTSSLTDSESEDELAGEPTKDTKESKPLVEGWWGFGDATECKLLAKWLEWKECNQEGQDDSDDEDSNPGDSEEGEQGSTGISNSKRLVTAIMDFASVLQYADNVVNK